ELYQSAVRQFRQGRAGQALEYLTTLLEVRPDTPEAIELKQRVEAQLAAGQATEVSFEDLHGVEEPMPSITGAGDVLTGGGPVVALGSVGEKPLAPALGDLPPTPSGKMRAL